MNNPIYISRSTIKSLWQEYWIYIDRLEIETMFGKMEIPFNEIENQQLSSSDLEDILNRDLKLKIFNLHSSLGELTFQNR